MKKQTELGNSNLIIVDWDGTIQDSETEYSGVPRGEFGLFNIEMIEKLNQYMDNGGKVTIVTSGTFPYFTMSLLEDLLEPSKTEEEIIEAKLKLENNLTSADVQTYREQAAEVYKFLKNTTHYYHVKKADDQVTIPNGNGGFIAQFFDIQSDFNKEYLEGYTYTPNGSGAKSLIELCNDNPGNIGVIGNSFRDNAFTVRLNGLVRTENIKNCNFTIVDGSMNGCNDFRYKTPIKFDEWAPKNIKEAVTSIQNNLEIILGEQKPKSWAESNPIRAKALEFLTCGTHSKSSGHSM